MNLNEMKLFCQDCGDELEWEEDGSLDISVNTSCSCRDQESDDAFRSGYQRGRDDARAGRIHD